VPWKSGQRPKRRLLNQSASQITPAASPAGLALRTSSATIQKLLILRRKVVSLRPKALEFLSEMEEIAKDRHALAHALWDAFNPSEPLSIGAMIIKAKPKTRNGLDIRRETITGGNGRGSYGKS
jgi:hypothetical protein